MLDTNICIYVMKNQPQHLLTQFNRLASSLCVSSITVAELVYGAKYSQQPAKNLQNIEKFLSRLQVLDYDQLAGHHYGDIKADLRRKGNLISDNDMHIAGHARSQGLVIVTNNTKEFTRVSALTIKNWL